MMLHHGHVVKHKLLYYFLMPASTYGTVGENGEFDEARLFSARLVSFRSFQRRFTGPITPGYYLNGVRQRCKRRDEDTKIRDVKDVALPQSRLRSGE